MQLAIDMPHERRVHTSTQAYDVASYQSTSGDGGADDNSPCTYARSSSTSPGLSSPPHWAHTPAAAPADLQHSSPVWARPGFQSQTSLRSAWQPQRTTMRVGGMRSRCALRPSKGLSAGFGWCSAPQIRAGPGCASAPRTSTMLTQCSGLQSIRKMCHFASIVSHAGDIRFCTAGHDC